MRILVITPRMPYPAPGADEQDRLEGMKLLQELGHELSVIAKVAQYQKQSDADALAQLLHARVETVPYSKRSMSLARLTDLRWIDGAAFEYTESTIHETLEREVRRFKPDIVWCDASFSWPLIDHIHHLDVPVIVRSLQIESTHTLIDEGRTLLNYVRAFGKDLGERTMASRTDAIAAINVHETTLYQRMGAENVVTVPLRNLPSILEDEPIVYRDSMPLRILFSGSTFSVAHNRDGAQRVFTEIAPRLEKEAPGAFTIHITGGKLPESLQRTLPAHVVYEGYIKDYAAFVRTMDIAITPALGTVGMHGKLFEPLARGIPTLSVPHALAGFPFKGGEHLLFGETTGEVVGHLLELRNRTYREKIGSQGRALALALFSRRAVLEKIAEVIALA